MNVSTFSKTSQNCKFSRRILMIKELEDYTEKRNTSFQLMMTFHHLKSICFLIKKSYFA